MKKSPAGFPRGWGRMEDLQDLAVFLASDASAYISGAVIPVEGGFMGKLKAGSCLSCIHWAFT
ncbi:MAG: SDR family oxidoreductase [Dialister invisus]